ncbi:MAG TPA: O-antigen ligase family protein, partial [Methylomirabilota bacterium]|nr:O-antigen ligase family protein [Methylomirabilota bacterium]
MSALRRAAFAALILGLAFSITLSQVALAVLAALWLWRLRDPALRSTAAFPLWRPVLAFGGATVLSALLSGHAAQSLVAARGLWLVLALYVTADMTENARGADRFLTWLGLAVAVAATVGLLQVGLCPGSGETGWSPAWLYHRCGRARGFFSIYMTLAGVLVLVLLATLPRVVPSGAFRPQFLPAWLAMLAGLIATFTRGAWIGFAAGVLTFLPSSRRAHWILVGLVVVAAAILVTPYEAQVRFPVLYEVRTRFLKLGDPEEAGVKERVY